MARKDPGLGPRAVAGGVGPQQVEESYLIRVEQSRRQVTPRWPTAWPPEASREPLRDRAALVKALLAAGESGVAHEVGRCNSTPLGFGPVTLCETKGGRRYLRGVNYCGRMPCLICGPYLRQTYMARLAERAEAVAKRGDLRQFLVTLSVQHDAATGMAVQVAVLGVLLKSLAGRSRWRRAVVGFIRVLEVTYGRNGLHPHLHLLLSVDQDQEEDAEAFARWVADVCSRVSLKVGAACAFSPGWWKPVVPGDLPAVLGYFGKPPLRGLIPATAYSAIWTESRGLRWAATAGCWKGGVKDKKGGKEANAEESPQVRGANPGAGVAVLLEIAPAFWRAMKAEAQQGLQARLCDPLYSPQVNMLPIGSLPDGWGSGGLGLGPMPAAPLGDLDHVQHAQGGEEFEVGLDALPIAAPAAEGLGDLLQAPILPGAQPWRRSH